MSGPFALGNLNCGYCRAPLVDHDLMALKICNHRMTGGLATAREKAISDVRDLIEAKQADWEKLGDYGINQDYSRKIEAANDILAGLETLKQKQK